MSKLIAANDKIILEIIEDKETVSEAGLILKTSALAEGYDRFKAIAIGKDVECVVQLGDTVIVRQGVHYPFPLDGKEYRIISSEMVMAILRD